MVSPLCDEVQTPGHITSNCQTVCCCLLWGLLQLFCPPLQQQRNTLDRAALPAAPTVANVECHLVSVQWMLLYCSMLVNNALAH